MSAGLQMTSYNVNSLNKRLVTNSRLSLTDAGMSGIVVLTKAWSLGNVVSVKCRSQIMPVICRATEQGFLLICYLLTFRVSFRAKIGHDLCFANA